MIKVINLYLNKYFVINITIIIAFFPINYFQLDPKYSFLENLFFYLGITLGSIIYYIILYSINIKVKYLKNIYLKLLFPVFIFPINIMFAKIICLILIIGFINIKGKNMNTLKFIISALLLFLAQMGLIISNLQF